MGFLSAPAMAPGERLPLVQDLSAAPGGVRRRPVDYFKVLLHFRLRSRLHEKPPRVVRSPFLGGGLSVLQILVTSCAHVFSLMKPWLLCHPSFEGSGQARLEEPLSGEETHKVRGDWFSSFHRSKFLLPQDDQVPPHLVTRPLLSGLGVGPPGWMTPRDRRPRGAPPVGPAVTNESFLSAVATDNTIPLDAGRKDSCRNQTSGRRR